MMRDTAMWTLLQSAYVWKQMGNVLAVLSGSYAVFGDTKATGRPDDEEPERTWGGLRVRGWVALVGILIGGGISVVAERFDHREQSHEISLQRRAADSITALSSENLVRLETLLATASRTATELHQTRRAAARTLVQLDDVSGRDARIAERQADVLTKEEAISTNVSASLDSQAKLLSAQQKTLANTERLRSTIAQADVGIVVTFGDDTPDIEHYGERVLRQAAGFRRWADNGTYTGENEQVVFDKTGAVRAVYVWTAQSLLWPSDTRGEAPRTVSALANPIVFGYAYSSMPDTLQGNAELFEMEINAGRRVDRLSGDGHGSGHGNVHLMQLYIYRDSRGHVAVRKTINALAAFEGRASGAVSAVDFPGTYWFVTGLGADHAGARVEAFTIDAGSSIWIVFCPPHMRTGRIATRVPGVTVVGTVYRVESADLQPWRARPECRVEP